jgi:hypothetical protein
MRLPGGCNSSWKRRAAAVLSCALSAALPLHGQMPDGGRGLGGLAEVRFENLTDRNISERGRTALAISAPKWKHAETANFVYHFSQGFVATQVSVEAEYYYRIYAKELERDTSRWERKCHLFIFEEPADWEVFKKSAALDPWTGGVHAGGELFLLRDPSFKWKGHTLGHEVAHLVFFRFFGNGIPLWLNEGYAEDASIRAFAAYFRARGYASKPWSQAVPPAEFIPLSELTAMLAYPADAGKVGVFYNESQRLTRFLINAGRPQFAGLLGALAQGARFESALARAYGMRFSGLEQLEREFRDYASKDHGTALQD